MYTILPLVTMYTVYNVHYTPPNLLYYLDCTHRKLYVVCAGCFKTCVQTLSAAIKQMTQND